MPNEKLYTVFFWEPRTQRFLVYTRNRTKAEVKADSRELHAAGRTSAVLVERDTDHSSED